MSIDELILSTEEVNGFYTPWVEAMRSAQNSSQSPGSELEAAAIIESRLPQGGTITVKRYDISPDQNRPNIFVTYTPPGVDPNKKGILFAGVHMDCVPAQEEHQLTYQSEGEFGHGRGVFDNGSNVLAGIALLQYLAKETPELSRSITVAFNADEEESGTSYGFDGLLREGLISTEDYEAAIFADVPWGAWNTAGVGTWAIETTEGSDRAKSDAVNLYGHLQDILVKEFGNSDPFPRSSIMQWNIITDPEIIGDSDRTAEPGRWFINTNMKSGEGHSGITLSAANVAASLYHCFNEALAEIYGSDTPELSTLSISPVKTEALTSTIGQSRLEGQIQLNGQSSQEVQELLSQVADGFRQELRSNPQTAAYEQDLLLDVGFWTQDGERQTLPTYETGIVMQGDLRTNPQYPLGEITDVLTEIAEQYIAANDLHVAFTVKPHSEGYVLPKEVIPIAQRVIQAGFDAAEISGYEPIQSVGGGLPGLREFADSGILTIATGAGGRPTMENLENYHGPTEKIRLDEIAKGPRYLLAVVSELDTALTEMGK